MDRNKRNIKNRRLREARQVTQDIYTFDELLPEVKEEVCDKMRNSDWYIDLVSDWVTENLKFAVEENFPNSDIDNISWDTYPRFFVIHGNIYIKDILPHINLTDNEQRTLDSLDIDDKYVTTSCDNQDRLTVSDCFDEWYIDMSVDSEDSYDRLIAAYEDIDEKVYDYLNDYCDEMSHRAEDGCDDFMSNDFIEEFIEDNEGEFYADGTEYYEH